MDTKERNGHRRLIGRPMCFTAREAELGNGMGRPNIIEERLYVQSSELQSNAKGVLFLLLSARASLLRLGADAACLGTMEDCVASFRKQHNLTDEDTNEGSYGRRPASAHCFGCSNTCIARSARTCRTDAAPSNSSSALNM